MFNDMEGGGQNYFLMIDDFAMCSRENYYIVRSRQVNIYTYIYTFNVHFCFWILGMQK